MRKETTCVATVCDTKSENDWRIIASFIYVFVRVRACVYSFFFFFIGEKEKSKIINIYAIILLHSFTFYRSSFVLCGALTLKYDFGFVWHLKIFFFWLAQHAFAQIFSSINLIVEEVTLEKCIKFYFRYKNRSGSGGSSRQQRVVKGRA